MKRIYKKPTMKSVDLITAEVLMNGSGEQRLEINDQTTISGSDFLGNEEGAHDIWGNENNGIW